tara:strand:+ start:736 stop:1575 length:840 start_codon:yes stop_codon:yes gene_type:complete
MINNTVSLIMPTYNRGYIIELAIKSIVKQVKSSNKIELIIGDDSDDINDSTESIANKYIDSGINIIYKKFDRIPLSDKINKLVELSSGKYYGLVGSDDIQSPYKISAFEESLAENPNAQVFGQKSFIYHDIIYNKSNLWTQNKDLEFFKAGSFVIINKDIFERVNGYQKGLWKRIDKSFYKKMLHLKPRIIDMSKTNIKIINSSIALQHIDNIWGRSAKGLLSKEPRQLSNFYAEPILINMQKELPNLFEDYNAIQKRLIDIYKKKFPIKYFWRNLTIS